MCGFCATDSVISRVSPTSSPALRCSDTAGGLDGAGLNRGRWAGKWGRGTICRGGGKGGGVGAGGCCCAARANGVGSTGVGELHAVVMLEPC